MEAGVLGISQDHTSAVQVPAKNMHTANMNIHAMQQVESVWSVNVNISQTTQVAQLLQRDRAAAWVSCGTNINVVFRIQRTLL